MSDDAKRKPEDPKAELEARLVKRAMEPFEKVLDDDEQEGMAIFMDLFVKTHPVMQRMVVRRVSEEAAIQTAKGAASVPVGHTPAADTQSGPEGPGAQASGVVSKDPEAAREPHGGEASGVVAKDPNRPARNKAGGEP